MNMHESPKELADHVRTYRNFVFGVRMVIGVAAVILLLLAYYLL